jgi:hypothetical protein
MTSVRSRNVLFGARYASMMVRTDAVCTRDNGWSRKRHASC